jgi:hypothetical protein
MARFSKKKAMGLTHGPHITERRPWAALTACPWPLFSSSYIPAEEGRPICKAKILIFLIFPMVLFKITLSEAL